MPRLILLALLFMVVAPPAASAGTYDVYACRLPNGAPAPIDGWAIYSQDGSLAAHFEFTIAITASGPRILTPWHHPDSAAAAAA